MTFSFISLYRGTRWERRHVAFSASNPAPATGGRAATRRPSISTDAAGAAPTTPPRRRSRSLATRGSSGGGGSATGGRRRRLPTCQRAFHRAGSLRQHVVEIGGEAPAAWRGGAAGGQPLRRVVACPTTRATGNWRATPGAAPISRRACLPHHADPESAPPKRRPAALAGGGRTERLRETAEGDAERRCQGAWDDRFHEPSRGATSRHRRPRPRQRRHRRAGPGFDAPRWTKAGGGEDRAMKGGRCVYGGGGPSVAGGSVVSALSSWGGVVCRSARVADEAEWAGAAGGRSGTMVWAEVGKRGEAESVLAVASMMFRESRKTKNSRERSCQSGNTPRGTSVQSSSSPRPGAPCTETETK